MRLPLLLIAPALVGAAFASQSLAAAEGEEETVTVRIAYADLDLSKAEDRAELERRVESRLRHACMHPSRPVYLRGPLVDPECVANARPAALAEVERVAGATASQGRKVAAN